MTWTNQEPKPQGWQNQSVAQLPWAVLDPFSGVTVWDTLNGGTIWDAPTPYTVWDLSFNAPDIWNKQNVEY
jgi:hypothetical protein